MKHQTICLVSFCFLLGLGTLGCKEDNPAFHRAADGSTNPSPDTPLAPPDTAPPADAPVLSKDADLQTDSGSGRHDAKADKKPDKDGDLAPTDALGLDARAEAGGGDAAFVRDAGLDISIPDGAVGPSQDGPDLILDAETTDLPLQVQDADTVFTPDGAEADVAEDVLPDPVPAPDAEMSLLPDSF